MHLYSCELADRGGIVEVSSSAQVPGQAQSPEALHAQAQTPKAQKRLGWKCKSAWGASAKALEVGLKFCQGSSIAFRLVVSTLEPYNPMLSILVHMSIPNGTHSTILYLLL